MAHHEKQGGHVEYYTPKYIFDAMGVTFDLDVAHPADFKTHVPCYGFISENSLEREWKGFVWMNPPYGSERNKIQWIEKFIEHGNGIALMPDRTSATWWQMFAKASDLIGFTFDKIKFELSDGTIADSPGTGNTFFAIGNKGFEALINLKDSGLVHTYKNFYFPAP